MAQKTKTELLDDLSIKLASAKPGKITAQDQREVLVDLIDSTINRAENILLFGDGQNSNKVIEVATQANGSERPKIRYNTSAGFWEYSNDGAVWNEFGSGSSLADGDKGDIIVSNSGELIEIKNDAVTLAKIVDGTANQALTTDGSGNPQYSETVDLEDPAYSNFFLESNSLGGWPRRLLFSLTGDVEIPTGQAEALSVLDNASNFRSHTGAKSNSTTTYLFPAGSLRVGMVIDVLAVVATPASGTTQDATVRLTDGTTVVTHTSLSAGNGIAHRTQFIVKDLTEGASILGVIKGGLKYSEVTGLTLDNGIGLDLFVYSYASDPAIVKAFNIEVS